MSWIIAFLSMAALDFIWAKYTKAATDHRALAAANLSAALVACNVVVTLGYVTNVWLIVPTLAGAWVGTYWGVRKPSGPR